MLSFLFGRKKAVVEPAPIVDAREMLIRKEEELEKRNRMLETKIKLLTSEAAASSSRQEKIICINKRHLYEKEVEKNCGMILKLLVQINAIESTNINTEALNVLDAASGAIKSRQKEWTPEKVADLTDEIQELITNQTEINEMISMPMPTDLDIDAELAALEPKEHLVIHELPSVPVASLSVASAAPTISEIDRELEAIA